MRHKKSTKKFKRTTEERRRLLLDLCNALVEHGQITTYTTRGKWFRSQFERLVTYCKRAGDNEVLALRNLRPYLTEANAKKMYREIAPKMAGRDGGYTRMFALHQEFSTHDKSVIMITE